MEVKTKFNLGDKTLVIKDGKAAEIEIKTILVHKDSIRYAPDEFYITEAYPEEECFTSKDELIAHVTSGLSSKDEE